MATDGTTVQLDGRRARRERGRTLVIDTAFELMQEGRVPPPVDEIAARAGVSVSTIFRYFDGLDDLQGHAVTRFRERFAPLLAVEPPGDAPLDRRIESLVDGRLRFYDSAGSIIGLGRLRALDHPRAHDAIDNLRRTLHAQARAHLRPELDSLPPATGADLLAVVDTLASPEAWEIVRRSHERSTRQIRRAWIRAIHALLDHQEPT